VPERVPPVVVVVIVATFRKVAVVVMVKGKVMMMIRIQTILDPGRLLKATSNRERNLLLSRLPLPY